MVVRRGYMQLCSNSRPSLPSLRVRQLLLRACYQMLHSWFRSPYLVRCVGACVHTTCLNFVHSCTPTLISYHRVSSRLLMCATWCPSPWQLAPWSSTPVHMHIACSYACVCFLVCGYADLLELCLQLNLGLVRHPNILQPERWSLHYNIVVSQSSN